MMLESNSSHFRHRYMLEEDGRMDVSKLTPAPWSVGVMESCTCDLAREWPCVVGPPKQMWHPDVDAVDTPRICRELHGVVVSSPVAMNCDDSKEDAEFIALARNAFDVMMRRGWGVSKARYAGEFGWVVWERRRIEAIGEGMALIHGKVYDDPFTALVEADRWYRGHMEGGS